MSSVALRIFVDLLRSLIHGGHRNRNNFELKEAPFRQGRQRNTAARVGAFRHHRFSDDITLHGGNPIQCVLYLADGIPRLASGHGAQAAD